MIQSIATRLNSGDRPSEGHRRSHAHPHPRRGCQRRSDKSQQEHTAPKTRPHEGGTRGGAKNPYPQQQVDKHSTYLQPTTTTTPWFDEDQSKDHQTHKNKTPTVSTRYQTTHNTNPYRKHTHNKTSPSSSGGARARGGLGHRVRHARVGLGYG